MVFKKESSGFLDPEKVLDELDIRENMLAAEFGSGSGLFAIILAKKLEKGRVYALDVQEPPLSALKGKIQMENLSNIEIIRCDLEKPRGSGLPEVSLDLVLISNVLFQVEDKNAMLKEAKRVLRSNGKLLVIDWLAEAPQGPAGARVSSQEIKKICQKLNLKLEKEFKAGAYHWALIFGKH